MALDFIASLLSAVAGVAALDVDERFIMHRYYSTRIAMIVGMVVLAGWFFYEHFINGVLRWDLFIILMVIAVTKVLAMIYFRITH
ncbi:MAG: hypothetical protein PVJ43_03190 [Gemmatimonadales bacterium]|jgi:hypothetical protein